MSVGEPLGLDAAGVVVLADDAVVLAGGGIVVFVLVVAAGDAGAKVLDVRVGPAGLWLVESGVTGLGEVADVDAAGVEGGDVLLVPGLRVGRDLDGEGEGRDTDGEGAAEPAGPETDDPAVGSATLGPDRDLDRVSPPPSTLPPHPATAITTTPVTSSAPTALPHHLARPGCLRWSNNAMT